MKKLSIIIVAVFAGLLIGCRHKSETMERLDAVEKALSITADSAQILISVIDSADLHTESERMAYVYLENLISVVQSDYANFNDSLVRETYDYAVRNKDKHFLAKASFLKGIADFRRRDMKQAIESQFDALSCLEGVKDPYLEGLVNEMLAIIYHDTFKPAPGLKYAQRAVECFKETENRHNILFSRLVVVKLEHAVNNHDRVIELAPGVAADAEECNETAIRFEALRLWVVWPIHMYIRSSMIRQSKHIEHSTKKV